MKPALGSRGNASIQASKASLPKVIRLMRHGTTEMNEYLRRHPYGSAGFRDPLFFDTRLTPSGIEGAKKAQKVAQSQQPPPELLVISPLTRALQTASHAYLTWYRGNVIVEPLARERVWLSSDTGRSPSELAQDFPNLKFDNLPEVWWYTGGSTNRADIRLEPQSEFEERVREFKAWLAARPEPVIDVVAHWGLIYELTEGTDFANCELRSFLLSSSEEELLPLDETLTVKQKQAAQSNRMEAVGLLAAVAFAAAAYTFILQ